VLTDRGCGPVTAAILIGHTAGAERFRIDACFARHAGTAPIPASSCNTTRHRLHRGGDRQLTGHCKSSRSPEHAPTPHPRLPRPQAREGKTKLEAIGCLKRHLAGHFRRLLYTIGPAASVMTAQVSGGLGG
jgi:transposase